jgi:hypothetical protein
MSVPLSQLDGETVSVEMSLQGRAVDVEGKARYQRHAGGNELTITLDDGGGLSLVIDEKSWNGTITRDPQTGRYRISLQQP